MKLDDDLWLSLPLFAARVEHLPPRCFLWRARRRLQRRRLFSDKAPRGGECRSCGARANAPEPTRWRRSSTLRKQPAYTNVSPAHGGHTACSTQRPALFRRRRDLPRWNVCAHAAKLRGGGKGRDRAGGEVPKAGAAGAGADAANTLVPPAPNALPLPPKADTPGAGVAEGAPNPPAGAPNAGVDPAGAAPNAVPPPLFPRVYAREGAAEAEAGDGEDEDEDEDEEGEGKGEEEGRENERDRNPAPL